MQFANDSNQKRSGLSLPDITAVLILLAAIAGFVALISSWTAPMPHESVAATQDFSLLKATFLSAARLIIAFVLSIVFAISVGYWASHSRLAERFVIPLIDILQSIPVLGFLPMFVLGLITIFPNMQLGLELAAILMIFTGMSWNLVLSFYGSCKTVPNEYSEVIQVAGYSRLGTLLRLELPYSMNGLVWNSMLSVAGGWFFLTICESFVLGDKSFKLVGLGTYVSNAAEKGDIKEILIGVFIIVIMLYLTDRLIWQPLLQFVERYQKSANEEDETETQIVIDFFSRSRFLSGFLRGMRRRYATRFFVPAQNAIIRRQGPLILRVLNYSIFICLGLFTAWGIWQMFDSLAEIPGSEWVKIAVVSFYSLLRVFFVLVLCAVIMIPFGLWLGSRRNLVRKLQTMIQVAAAFPAPMIFPIILTVILYLSIPMSIGSIFLMMMGAQWYLFFNVLAGAQSVPAEYVDMARLTGMGRREVLKRIYLPATFPYIITGLITAAGGAWNTSIVAELVVFRGQELITPGLGSYIAKAAYNEQYPELMAAVAVMVLLIILINRFVWARMYNLAAEKYRFES